MKDIIKIKKPSKKEWELFIQISLNNRVNLDPKLTYSITEVLIECNKKCWEFGRQEKLAEIKRALDY